MAAPKTSIRSQRPGPVRKTRNPHCTGRMILSLPQYSLVQCFMFSSAGRRAQGAGVTSPGPHLCPVGLALAWPACLIS